MAYSQDYRKLALQRLVRFKTTRNHHRERYVSSDHDNGITPTFRYKISNTAVLVTAPRPPLPLRTPPKQLSSNSI